MIVVNKKGETIRTEPVTVSHTKFLEEIIKPFKHIRAGVGGGKKPFKYIYLKVDKKEVVDTVRSNQMKVTYSIMYNSRMNEELGRKYQDALYIHKMRMTLLDKPE